MRGKGISPNISENISGITPAHAGKSPNDRVGKREIKDHPRTCGEKSFSAIAM